MKKAIVFVAALAVGAMAWADGEDAYQCLYWQVDAKQVASGIESYDAAMFYKVDGSGKVELSGIENTTGGRWSSDPKMADLSGYGDGDSFLFELAKWSGNAFETVGTSATFTYSQLASYLTSVAGGSNIPTQGVLAPSFSAIPEPTSGLLMLIGIAGLALRRKRA